MDGEKLRLLIDQLSSADAAGKLRWTRGVKAGTYQAAFPNSSIVLEDVRRRGEFESLQRVADQMAGRNIRTGIILRLLDESGRDVIEISASELEEEGDHERGSLIKRLYEHARYEAGGERLIDELIANLAADMK
jgi:hypothetical protein